MYSTGNPELDKLIAENVIKAVTKTIKGLFKKKVVQLADDKTQQDLDDVIRSILMGKMPPENFDAMIEHAQGKLTPFHESITTAKRMQANVRTSVAKKKVAAKKMAYGGGGRMMAAKKKPAAKKAAAKKPAAKRAAAKKSAAKKMA